MTKLKKKSPGLYFDIEDKIVVYATDQESSFPPNFAEEVPGRQKIVIIATTSKSNMDFIIGEHRSYTQEALKDLIPMNRLARVYYGPALKSNVLEAGVENSR